ncbi:unnamed protein product, partial [marine sediment metagenome]
AHIKGTNSEEHNAEGTISTIDDYRIGIRWCESLSENRTMQIRNRGK